MRGRERIGGTLSAKSKDGSVKKRTLLRAVVRLGGKVVKSAAKKLMLSRRRGSGTRSRELDDTTALLTADEDEELQDWSRESSAVDSAWGLEIFESFAPPVPRRRFSHDEISTVTETVTASSLSLPLQEQTALAATLEIGVGYTVYSRGTTPVSSPTSSSANPTRVPYLLAQTQTPNLSTIPRTSTNETDFHDDCTDVDYESESQSAWSSRVVSTLGSDHGLECLSMGFGSDGESTLLDVQGTSIEHDAADTHEIDGSNSVRDEHEMLQAAARLARQLVEEERAREWAHVRAASWPGPTHLRPH